MQMNIRKHKGITLIALIITIIVLLILAGVAIASLTGENGILTKASTVKAETEKATAEEEVKLEVVGSYDDNGKFDYETFKTNVENNLGATVKDNEDGTCTVTNKGYDVTVNKTTGKVISTIKTGETLPPPYVPEVLAPGDTATSTNKNNYNDGITNATIPKGFTVSNINGEKTVANGLVIYDIPESDLTKTNLWTDTNKDGTLKVQTDYNQFVWIPVDNSSDAEFNRVYKRTEGYQDKNLQSMLSSCGEADSTGVNSFFCDNEIEENSSTVTEAPNMYASVKDYGGFYIGRYEAGIEGTTARVLGTGINDSVVIKKNKHVYNYIGWSNSNIMDVVEGGAVEKSRNMTFANSNIKAKTTLCYGVQWDAALNFIDPNFITNQVTDGVPECEENSYLVDSTNQGWYENNYEDGNADHKTGIDLTSEANPPKNIYDIAGNVWEWTMESYDTDRRVIRGGCYLDSGSSGPASIRNRSLFPSYAYNVNVGFRVTLYL